MGLLSVIIPTYNRPDDLKAFIESLLKQTQLPNEVIIVDDGNLPEIPLSQNCHDAGIQTIYLKKEIPGLTSSRNFGIERARGDIIFFFDDDVVIAPQFIEQVMHVYNNDKNNLIGGVCGRETNFSPTHFKQRLRKFLEIIFLNSGFSEGKILSSGFFTDYGETIKAGMNRCEVDFLSGCSFSFRKEVFKDFMFNTKEYLNYGMGEDKDFSCRVGTKYKLIYEPSATLVHNHSVIMRAQQFKAGKMYILFMHNFFTTIGKKGSINKMLFYYAFLGFFVIQIVNLLFSRRSSTLQYIKGMFNGISEIATRKNAEAKG
jgi:glucosyl-dolichyl phosphate glucuronosyltransferase